MEQVQKDIECQESEAFPPGPLEVLEVGVYKHHVENVVAHFGDDPHLERCCRAIRPLEAKQTRHHDDKHRDTAVIQLLLHESLDILGPPLFPLALHIMES